MEAVTTTKEDLVPYDYAPTPADPSYDPNALVVDVQNLLQAKGLRPDATGCMGAATGAAAELLRSFGVFPAADVTSIDRRNAADDW